MEGASIKAIYCWRWSLIMIPPSNGIMEKIMRMNVDQARVHYFLILMRLIQRSIGLNQRKSPRLQWSSVGRPWWNAVVMTLSRCHVDMLSSTALNLSHSMLGDLSEIIIDVKSVMSYSAINEYWICCVPRNVAFRVINLSLAIVDIPYRGNSASEHEPIQD